MISEREWSQMPNIQYPISNTNTYYIINITGQQNSIFQYSAWRDDRIFGKIAASGDDARADRRPIAYGDVGEHGVGADDAPFAHDGLPA